MNSSPIPQGKPGIVPRWTSSAKIGVGTAMTGVSNIWFTISHGIINEVYFPRIDIASIRDMGLLVTNGNDFFSEEKRHTRHDYSLISDGVLAHRLTNTCLEERYRIEKTVITDPRRNVLLQEIRFIPLKGKLEDYHLYVLLAPHIGNAGYGNNGWAGDYKGIPMLFAERAGIALACACSVPFLRMNCGYVGVSDTWQDLSANKRMTYFYSRAEDGNIALAAEIDLQACQGHFVLALGFAQDAQEAGLQTRAALSHDFALTLKSYVSLWEKLQHPCCDLCAVDKEGGRLFRTSIAVLKCHQGKRVSGSNIASLSIPWGFTKGDNDLGGYHLIWPRDQVETAFAFLAADDAESARETLRFLLCTQERDGHWAQCFWVDGKPYWQGIQLDETALPVLLADELRRGNHLKDIDPSPLVAKAAAFIVHNGPPTEQDRWEEASGYNLFTLAIEISALLAAAEFFDAQGKSTAAAYLREVADWWNDNIENWLYATNTDLTRRFGVDGYYMRLAPTEICENHVSCNPQIFIKNRPSGQNMFAYSSIVSVDALALVRFGLRAADDPRILNTVKVIDALLKTDTSKGPVWHRYNEDGYGEHQDGSPYDGTGIGRGWPLLVGERAHYELAKGNKQGAMELLRAMTRMAGVGGLIPEQIWDAKDIPERRLYNGHSTGSAKPLVWAHAEYITLLRSLKEGKVFGMPPQSVQRYIIDKVRSSCAVWRFEHTFRFMPAGKKLRIQSQASATVHWSIDEWKSSNDSNMEALPELDLFYVNLPVETAKIGTKILFTFFWVHRNQWEGTNFEVQIQ